MTPKEKATELINKCYDRITEKNGIFVGVTTTAKNCAKLTAIEVADECNKYFEAISSDRVNYWVAVKAEIERS
jgi:hypothetical protein